MMMKIMKRKTRQAVIVLLSILLLVSGGLTYWWLQKPTEKETMIPVYTGTQVVGIDYQVFFSPNNFFPEPVVGPGQAYITPLTQYIETVFNYRFSGDIPADISGQYQVDAALTGYMLKEKKDSQDMQEREKVKVWGKSYPLLPPTPFTAHDRQLEIKQVIPVDIRSYADFAQQVTQGLKFSADLVELTVTYSVEGGAKTSQGEIREPVQSVLVIPIEGSSFMVGGMLNNQKEKSITRSQIDTVPGVKAGRYGFGIVTGLWAVLLLLVLFKTIAENEDPVEKELRQIIKKHGDRIAAAIFSAPVVSDNNSVVLSSFNDLVKVADELAQPILYENVPATKHSFYVINDPLVYYYSLDATTLPNLAYNFVPQKGRKLDVD